MTVYLHDWEDSGEDGMLRDFGIDKSALDGANVLVASYTYEDYNGDAYVLFERGGKLFEVHGSHCSCYGLGEDNYCGDTETQWQPEETSEEAIRHIIAKSTWGGTEEIKDFILAALDGRKSGGLAADAGRVTA